VSLGSAECVASSVGSALSVGSADSAGSVDSVADGEAVSVGVAVSDGIVTTSSVELDAGAMAWVVANAAVVPMKTPATARGSASLRFMSVPSDEEDEVLDGSTVR
jgi:hypothetical protein